MKRQTFQIYNDLLGEIEYLEINLRYIQRDYENTVRKSIDTPPDFKGVVDYESERVVGGITRLPLDVALKRCDKLNIKAREYEKMLEEKHKWREEIEERWKALDGLEYKVFYGRYVEGKTLPEIAEELNYSDEHIRRVSAGVKV